MCASKAVLGRLAARGGDLAGRVRVVAQDDVADVWEVELRFQSSTVLGADLAEYARRTSCPEFLLFELHFPSSFPTSPPSLRLVRPRLQDSQQSNTPLGTPTDRSTEGAVLPLSHGGIVCLPELASGNWWPGQDLASVLLDLHQRLVQSSARLDMGSVRPYNPPSTELALGVTLGLPTVAKCMTTFPVACLERAAIILPELAVVPPGRVVLPHRCAMEVYFRAFGSTAAGIGASTSDGALAVHVEIKNHKSGSRAFAGLAEASAMQDAAVFLPSWMLQQLFLKEGDEVRIRVVALPQCAFVRLQPHSKEFYELAGEEPQLLLQEALAPLPALTAGLSVPVELPALGGSSAFAIRRLFVFIARLEDSSGNEVLAAKLPAHGGVLGEHEVRVDFLPAADLAESGIEYKERVEKEAVRAARAQELLQQRREISRQQREAALAAARPPGPSAEDLARIGDGSSGFELCFKLPNGKQLRRRFPPNLAVADLKLFLQTLADDESSPWQPTAHTNPSDLDLACAFPRRNLADDETVSAIGDRAVVQVAQKGSAAEGDMNAADPAAEAVLFSAALEESVKVSLTKAEEEKLFREPPTFTDMCDAAAGGLDAVGFPSLHRTQEEDSGLAALPESELRALALSLGISPTEVARTTDVAELVALISHHQARAAARSRLRPSVSLPARQHRATSLPAATDAAMSQLNQVATRRPGAAGSSSNETAGGSSGSRAKAPASRTSADPTSAIQCPLSDAQLSRLGLTPALFLDLPPDTREAILAATPAEAASPGNSSAADAASGARNRNASSRGSRSGAAAGGQSSTPRNQAARREPPTSAAAAAREIRRSSTASPRPREGEASSSLATTPATRLPGPDAKATRRQPRAEAMAGTASSSRRASSEAPVRKGSCPPGAVASSSQRPPLVGSQVQPGRRPPAGPPDGRQPRRPAGVVGSASATSVGARESQLRCVGQMLVGEETSPAGPARSMARQPLRGTRESSTNRSASPSVRPIAA